MVLLLAVAAAIPLHFRFDAGEFTNAVYQTVCVTGRITCSRDIYQRFWHAKYHATPEDEARFSEFGTIFDEMESVAKPGNPTPFLPNDFSYIPGLDIRNRLVAAALASKSAADFRKRAAALAKPGQVERLAAILAYFQQRLHPWWVATGQPIIRRRFTGIERRFRLQGVPDLAREVAAFLETQPDFRDYYLHVVPSPEFEADEGDGTAVLNQFCLEVTKRFQADDLGWIAVHEFTHSLYDHAPHVRKDALMRQFVESGDASAQPFYLYLNEAMATAAELLLAERNGKTLDDPYTDLYVPRLGKAVLPLLRTALERRKTLYGGFASSYLAAGRAALGDDADGLQFRYSCIALLGDEAVRNVFLDRLPLRYFVTTREAWNRFSRLDGILMLRYDQIHFGGGETEMQDLMQKHRGFVYIGRNAEHMEVFMLGRDNAALEQLGKVWAESQERTREGLIFAIE
jgi:hypothetical protein